MAKPTIVLPLRHKKVAALMREHRACAAADRAWMDEWRRSESEGAVEPCEEPPEMRELAVAFGKRREAMKQRAAMILKRVGRKRCPSTADIALLMIAARHSLDARRALPDALARSAGLSL